MMSLTTNEIAHITPWLATDPLYFNCSLLAMDGLGTKHCVVAKDFALANATLASEANDLPANTVARKHELQVTN